MDATPRMLVVFTLAAAGVVGIVIALASGQWWVLAPALVVHAIATAVAMGFIGSRLRQTDKPDPVTEAREKEEHAHGHHNHRQLVRS